MRGGRAWGDARLHVLRAVRSSSGEARERMADGTGRKVAKDTLTGANIRSATLGTVRNADHATSADHAKGAATPTFARITGAPGPGATSFGPVSGLCARGRGRGCRADLAACPDHRDRSLGAVLSPARVPHPAYERHARGQRRGHRPHVRQRDRTLDDVHRPHAHGRDPPGLDALVQGRQ